MGDFVIGCSLNIMGSIFINFGNNLMSLGHRKKRQRACTVAGKETAVVPLRAVSQKSDLKHVKRVKVVPEEKAPPDAELGTDSDSEASEPAERLSDDHMSSIDKSFAEKIRETIGRARKASVAPSVQDLETLTDPTVDMAATYTDDEEEAPEKSRTWTIGTAIFVFGSLLLFSSFGFAPQSVLAALEGVQFITNIFFGKLVLNAPITRRMLAGTVALVAGMVMVVSFSRQTTQNFSSQELQDLYKNPAYIAYILFAVTTLGIAGYVHDMYAKKREAGAERLPYHNLVYPISFCYFSAVIGTQQLLMAKCLSNLLLLTLEGQNQFQNWFTYFCLLAWIGAASYFVYRTDLALKLFKAQFIIPVLQVNFTLLAITSGGIYFKEFNGQPAGHILGFIAGCAVIFFGVYLLAPADAEEDEPEPFHFVAVLEERQSPRGSALSSAHSVDSRRSGASPVCAEDFEFARAGSSILIKNEEFAL